MSEELKLLPCPFGCGDTFVRIITHGAFSEVVCTSCGCERRSITRDGAVSAWNLRQQVPAGLREFIENIATVGSEPLNSAVVYRDLASRRHFMAELRNKARALLAEAPKPEDVE